MEGRNSFSAAAQPKPGAGGRRSSDNNTDNHCEEGSRTATSSSAEEEPSPATQTLDLLSQGSAMADLRYDISNLEKDLAAKKTSSSSSPLRASSSASNADRSRANVGAVKLASVAEHGYYDDDDETIDPDSPPKLPPPQHRAAATTTTKTTPDESGYRHEHGPNGRGQQPQRQEQPGTGTGDGEQPVASTVARNRNEVHSSSTTNETIDGLVTNETASSRAKVTASDRPNAVARGAIGDTTKGQQGEDNSTPKSVSFSDAQTEKPAETNSNAVPFCSLCAGKKVKQHHPWCPQHPQFDLSGSKEKLRELRIGVALGCELCLQTYQQGRIVTSKNGKTPEHSKVCQRDNTKGAGMNDAPQKKPAKRATQTASTKRKRASTNGKAKKKRPITAPSPPSSGSDDDAKQTQMRPGTRTQKRSRRAAATRADNFLYSMALESDSSSGDEDESRKMAPAVTTGRSRIRFSEDAMRPVPPPPPLPQQRDRSLATANHQKSKKKATATGKNRSVGPKQSKTNNRRRSQDIQGAARRNKKEESGRSRLTVTPNHQGAAKQYHDSPGSDADVTDDEASDLEVVEVTWKVAADPWGPEGYTDGDAVLFSGTTPLRSHESVSPSPRFEIDPFVTYKRYNKTHHTPLEGFQVLELRRDPLATLPWGFTSRRHEFGGACLVRSVDPLSAAATAVRIRNNGAFSGSPLPYAIETFSLCTALSLARWNRSFLVHQLQSISKSRVSV